MLQRLQLKSTGEFDPDSLDQHFSPVPSFLCCIASADSVKISQSRTLKGNLAQLLALTSPRMLATMLYNFEGKVKLSKKKSVPTRIVIFKPCSENCTQSLCLQPKVPGNIF